MRRAARRGLDRVIVTIEEAALDGDGRLRVSGWAAGEEAITGIDIVAAGMKWGDAEHGLPRPDVAADYPEFVDGERSGFVFAGALGERARAAEQVVAVARVAGRPAQSAARAIERPPERAARRRIAVQLRDRGALRRRSRRNRRLGRASRRGGGRRHQSRRRAARRGGVRRRAAGRRPLPSRHRLGGA